MIKTKIINNILLIIFMVVITFFTPKLNERKPKIVYFDRKNNHLTQVIEKTDNFIENTKELIVTITNLSNNQSKVVSIYIDRLYYLSDIYIDHLQNIYIYLNDSLYKLDNDGNILWIKDDNPNDDPGQIYFRKKFIYYNSQLLTFWNDNERSFIEVIDKDSGKQIKGYSNDYNLYNVINTNNRIFYKTRSKITQIYEAYFDEDMILNNKALIFEFNEEYISDNFSINSDNELLITYFTSTRYNSVDLDEPYYLIKTTDDGKVLYDNELNIPPNHQARYSLIDSDNNLYQLTYHVSKRKTFLSKLNTEGIELWNKKLPLLSNPYHSDRVYAIDNDNNIYVTTSNQLIKLNSFGDIISKKSYGTLPIIFNGYTTRWFIFIVILIILIPYIIIEKRKGKTD